MEKTINPACSSDAIKILLVIVLVALILWMLYQYFRSSLNKSSESFNSTFKQNIKTVSNAPTIYERDEVPMIEDPPYDEDRGTVQSDPKLIQQQYFTPWGTIIQVDDLATDGSQIFSETPVTDYTLNFNQCSPACCGDQWPVPFKVPVDKILYESEGDLVPNSYFCNNGCQSGCLCMTKEQSGFIRSRGSNGD